MFIFFFVFGFEIGTPDEIEAMTDRVKITHKCEGKCSSGVEGVLTYCSCCEFVYENDVIIGCECKSLLGCCVHTIIATEESSIPNKELSDYIDTEILNN